MITANDVFKETMNDFDPIIDEIITNKLLMLFKRSPENSVRVHCKDITSGYRVEKEYFIKQMNMRGFYVEVKCDDRPCAMPYYKIIIPPQEQ